MGRTHGKTETAEYKIWCKMRDRCHNPNCRDYVRYGGRGITIDPAWDNFEQFLEDMGLRPSPEHSIDRKNNELGYSAANCRWATAQEQALNRRSNVPMTYAGKTQTMSAWAKELGVPYTCFHERMRHGWSVEEILSTPVQKRRMVTYLGRTQSVHAWSKELGVDGSTVNYRIRKGMDPLESLLKSVASLPKEFGSE